MQSALEAIHEYYKAFSTPDVSAIASYTAAGSGLERIPFSYVVHRTETDWKIAVPVAEQ